MAVNKKKLYHTIFELNQIQLTSSKIFNTMQENFLKVIYLEENKRPDWGEYFLNIAQEVGKRSTCLRRHYGAIIVKDKIIVSTGYNGAPRGEANCIDTGLCERERLHIPKGERYELCVAVHGEQNAIINADPLRMKGATIYIVGINVADGSFASGAPCLLCRRMIKNAQIDKVIYRDVDGGIVSKNVEDL